MKYSSSEVPTIMSVSHSRYIVENTAFSSIIILSRSLRIEDTLVAEYSLSESGDSLQSIWVLDSHSYYNQHYNWNFQASQGIGEFQLKYWIIDKNTLERISAEVQTFWTISVIPIPTLSSSFPQYLEVDSKFS